VATTSGSAALFASVPPLAAKRPSILLILGGVMVVSLEKPGGTNAIYGTQSLTKGKVQGP
jgi:hypothetical protein